MVLAGWTFTSTMSRGSSTSSTQPGNLPFIMRFEYASSSAAVRSWDLTSRPLTKNVCMPRVPREAMGEVTKPVTPMSPSAPLTSRSESVNSRPREA